MTTPQVAGHRLRVWHGTAVRPSAADWAVLSAEEGHRARRFLDTTEAGHYVCAHAAVRRIIAGQLGCPAGALRFGRESCPGCGDGEHGPPRVVAPDTALRFNHSRSGAAWLLALAPGGRRVGADIERIRPLSAFPAMVETCLAPDERAWVTEDTDPERRRRRFYRCWTRKEAVLKAVGTGLAGGIARLDVRPSEAGPAAVRVDGPGGGTFLVHDLRPRSGALGAVAEELARCPGGLSRGSSERTGPEFIKGAEEAT